MTLCALVDVDEAEERALRKIAGFVTLGLLIHRVRGLAMSPAAIHQFHGAHAVPESSESVLLIAFGVALTALASGLRRKSFDPLRGRE
jgi:hypothetical protein